MAEKEYIERETAVLSLLDKGQHSRRYKLGEIWELDFEEIREAINSIPAADVRPVVLCRDCKWTETDGMEEPAIYCKKWDRWEMPLDGFCWLGRKRGES